MRGDRERLKDILEAISRIERHTARGRAALDDELVQVWVVHNLEIVGEAARGVSEELRALSPEVPWRGVIGLRNVLAHGYFGIDVARVRRTVEVELPKLRDQIERLSDDADQDKRSPDLT